jgi:hypothetical protein
LVFTAAGNDSSSSTATAQLQQGGPVEAGAPVVAFVRDAAAGEVVIMTGVEELVVHDPDLVARIVGAG